LILLFKVENNDVKLNFFLLVELKSNFLIYLDFISFFEVLSIYLINNILIHENKLL
jgi:hypothetical protein